VTKSLAILVSLVAAFLLMFGGSASADPTPDVAYPDEPQLQRAYENGFYRGAADGYSDGRDDGYEDGYEAGKSAGEAAARDAARDQEDAENLRDEVEGAVDEGGADLGPQITAPTPSATTETDYVDESVDESQGSGIPWWPLSFAVVASVWFVTRRRRLDAEDAAAQHD